jgi:glutathione synthase/RimK-type ligase-like ATP-grasp enzyme
VTARVALATAAELPRDDLETPRLARELVQLGLHAELVPWTDPMERFAAFDATVIRSTWDYTASLDRYLAWCEAVDAATALWNPAPIVRWNAHKGYLAELADLGAPVLPTAVVGRGTPDGDVVERLGSFGGGEVVVKPAVDAGGRGAMTGRFDEPAVIAHATALVRDRDLLVQPLADAIRTEGEYSVVVMGGAPLLARRKLPARGEFRIHEHHGGSTHPVALDAELLRPTTQVLSVLQQPVAYARVDLVRYEGSLALMEVELIEPFLYLESDDEFRSAAKAIAEVAGA